ncbi:MAG TPA: UrcA family protein [Phenylobacterium sp.]
MNALAISALFAVAFASSAAAGQTLTTSIAVSPAGLDLSSQAGAEAMAGRLDRAAVRVCGASSFSLREYQAAVRNSACYRDAMGQALTALNAPAVNTVLRERGAVPADR